MNSSDILHILARMYHRISGFAHSLNDKYGMEWILVLLAALAIILFLMREKPLTNLLLWILKGSGKWLKKAWNWTLSKLSKLRFSPLSPKLKKLAEDLDELAADSFGRYDRPHYIVLSQESDVEAVIRGANDFEGETLNLEDSRVNDNDGKNWYIFNKGCIFHFPDPVGVSRELQQIRPERPMDGIIVCLPAHLFLPENHKQRQVLAEKFYSQLWQMQKKFHFVLPVYLLLTECEEGIEGFDSFWGAECLGDFKQEIFGWSNPNEKFKPYENEWVTQGMEQLSHQLERIQLNVICDKNISADLELMLFPSRFSQLTTGISDFCEKLFSQSSFHESFMFRGFYFCGQVEQQETMVGKENPPKTAGAVWFLRDLFYKRIFSEANLAFAPQQHIFSSDRRLRVYQYFFLALFTFLSAWLYMDQQELSKQSLNLTNNIRNLPPRPILDENGAQIHYVSQVLDHISKMDASNLKYGSIFLSYTSNIEDKLGMYFAEKIFGKIVFPSLECQAQRRIRESITRQPNDGNFDPWLAALSNDFALQQELYRLMISTDNYTNKEVEQKFSYLVQHLFDQELPASFYQRSDEYIKAIRSHVYQPMAPTYHKKGTNKQGSEKKDKNKKDQGLCEIQSFNDQATWSKVKLMASEHLDNVANSVRAPKNFFSQLDQLESLPLDSRWNRLTLDFSTQLNQYTDWSARLQNQWLMDAPQENSCLSARKSLLSLSKRVLGNEDDFVEIFYQQCMANVNHQLHLDNGLITPSLYVFSESTPPSFSTEASHMLNSVSQLTPLSFLQVTPETQINDHNQLKGSGLFFWSIEHLNRALRMAEEYESFTTINFASDSVPSRRSAQDYQYLSQAIALKQLQLAMKKATNRAQQYDPGKHFPDQYKPVSQQEAKLISYVSNFKQARPLLLKIHQAYSKLGLNESRNELFTTANYHAFKLLNMVDKLQRQGNLYQPLETPLWGAHQYIRSMFGISGKGQLQDYLASESERMGYIATEYAEPLLTFLSSTKAVSVNYELFNRWNNTLIEYNKKFLHKDNNNALDELESFFENQLLLTDQSNCFKQSKTFHAPQGNNLYAEANKMIVDEALQLCESYRKDKIEMEYARLSERFTELLAGKYPFTRSPLAQNVTPEALQKFLSYYPGKSSGLENRMENLVWVKRNDKRLEQYRQARTFVKALDQSLDLFSSAFTASAGGSNGGLEVNFEFDVLSHQSIHTPHISQWQLGVGRDYVTYPSVDNARSHTLLWSPSSAISLELDWAENSPFSARALEGKTRGNKLTYEADGLWSLITFIQTYRSSTLDTHNITQGSMLLDFTADLSDTAQITTSPLKDLLAFGRVTLYGPAAKDKQRQILSLPEQFPDHVPELGETP